MDDDGGAFETGTASGAEFEMGTMSRTGTRTRARTVRTVGMRTG
jgi:hypothetical protein